MKVEVFAPAKINLTLEVGAKREDNYHNLTSVMARIDFCDRLILEACENASVRFFSNAPSLPQDNLCVKTARRYLDLKGISKGVNITLESKIPFASGMGAGSADAAAVIEGMETLFGALEPDTRHTLARSIGADVPYCLEKTPCLCTGIGDECQKIECGDLSSLFIVVVKEGEKLSTAQVYEDFDKMMVHRHDCDHISVVRAIEVGDVKALAKGVFNTFEDVVFKSSPHLAKTKSTLLEKVLPLIMLTALIAVFIKTII